MSKNSGDYLASAGSFLLDATREVVWRHEDESVQAERLAGMSTTVAVCGNYLQRSYCTRSKINKGIRVAI